MKGLTPRELQDFYYLVRNVQWRYKLDEYEKEVLRGIVSTLRKARGEVKKGLGRWVVSQFQDERGEALLAEFDKLTAATRAQLSEDISDAASWAGEYSVNEHVSILSFAGKVASFNNVALSAAQFRQFFAETPLGGKLLTEWVDSAFDSTVKAGMLEELRSGVLQGEGYPKLVKRLLSDFDLTKREAITLSRTYVQSANVAAQQAVYAANADIVQGWKWCATLENGYSSTGRGTCPVCAALDGKEFKLNDGPPIPRHPRCRCVALPVTLSYHDLGLDLNEMEGVARPYTIRPDQNIDAGGKRTIQEVGFHQGNYASWWETQGREVQDRSIGPGRAELVRSGAVQFGQIVDDAGELRTIKELEALAGR